MSLKNVISNGYCTGCAGCQSVDKDIKIEVNASGFYHASRSRQSSTLLEQELNAICPFSDSAPNETELAEGLFNTKNFSKEVGQYENVYVGHIKDSNTRLESSSGGVTTWLAKHLMKESKVDAIIHVGETPEGIGYRVSKSVEEFDNRSNKKSRYQPVTLEPVLEYLMTTEDKILFIGIPCFVKSIRLMEKEKKIKNVGFVFSILCGHMKSFDFAKSFAWQVGIEPKKFAKLDYRLKKPNYKASNYFIEATDISGNSRIARNFSLFGSDWGLGFFKHKACDFCDDIAGELADVSFGDAWLPDYLDDYLGNNIIVSRSRFISSILENVSSELKMEEVSHDDFVISQAANYRNRRSGVIARANVAKKWVPKKRLGICPTPRSNNEASLYVYRQKLSAASIRNFNIAKACKVYLLFELLMIPSLFKYDQIKFGRRLAVKNLLVRVKNLIFKEGSKSA